MANRTILKGISASAFTSDTDQAALAALKKLPLLPMVVQKFYEAGIDRWTYCYNMSMSVRCGPRQLPTLYRIFQESCEILDVPEPELYVTNNPIPNAFAGGVERPYVILRSGMIDTMSDEQLYHLMGHELGHIKAGHILYMSVGQVLLPLLEMLGRRTLGLGDVASISLVLALYEWYRQAEISADRAGLLVSQSLDTSIAANLMLTAGPSRFREELSLEAFSEQAQTYQEAGAREQIGRLLLYFLTTATFTHPAPVHRTQMLQRWALSGAFDRVMSGDYTRTSQKSA